ncbi:hypothetical protein RZS28_11980 [Methylocapsa polymorpha]|uniref:Uncharacterized protein n=1 Tax=Methylocapsa polymorpha TaxID=3080828 RepID=A0ABZ0HPR8_9HYPH|nr:hypothetical protein RZS28_11980 [Methylocapsa sp. RX1]
MIFVGCVANPAHGEIQLSCDAFKKNPDGTWSPKNRMTLSTDGMDLAVGPGAKFVSGAHFGRLDLYAILERNCNHQ